MKNMSFSETDSESQLSQQDPDVGIPDIKFELLLGENGTPLYHEWLIKRDEINKTLEWRDHWAVIALDSKIKRKYENKLSKGTEYKWLKQYKAVTSYNGTKAPKPVYSDIKIWATDDNQAEELFNQMGIAHITIKKV